MKKYTKYFLSIVAALVGTVSFTGCDDFLDEIPNKSGSSYIYHMDQLKELSGSLDLYMFSSTNSINVMFGVVNSYITDQNLLTDNVEFSPEYYTYGLKGNSYKYLLYCLDKQEFANNNLRMSATWTPSWDRIYRFNVILENIDKVTQTTQQVHDQVAGEAYFGRAYYHFLLMLQYCLWDENEPGIGYREDTNPNGVPARRTVGYTVGKIYDDLAKAEELLTKAGRTEFYPETNFRPSVPTVKALRARIDLYRGNYDSALSNANAALAANSKLVTFKDEPIYKLYNNIVLNYLNEDDTAIKEKFVSQVPTDFRNLGIQTLSTYPELFITSVTTVDYCPISERLYNLFDRENDARWIYFYNSSYTIQTAPGSFTSKEIDGVKTSYCITNETQKWLKPWNRHCYYRFSGNGGVSALGMTTAEMMLIKAECLARSGKTAEAAQVLKDLRVTRFMNADAANNIGGSVQDVIDERDRELASLWRFYDIKRLNGAENAGITVKRVILSDPKDINSATTIEIAPNDPRWALPIYNGEVKNMGWEQNRGWN